jgi:lipoprotein NlpD
MLMSRGPVGKWALALLVGALAGCVSTVRTPAPVEDRVNGGGRGHVEVNKHLPGAENAGKPGYYTVRPGDTVFRIGLEAGQNWRDIVRWNNLDNPDVIEAGRVLRVIPPTGQAAASSSEGVVAHPVAPSSAAGSSLPPATGAKGPAGASTPTLPPINTPPVAPGDDDVAWAWPTSSGAPVLATFDEQKNKGIDIGGRPGDPVLASADGKVVYAGAGLRGYGNLIILKHNNTYLTAYAHNQALLVKEDQAVRRGQKIAEMGSSDAERVQLHFEIRRLGKPVDPSKLLPAR